MRHFSAASFSADWTRKSSLASEPDFGFSASFKCSSFMAVYDIILLAFGKVASSSRNIPTAPGQEASRRSGLKGLGSIYRNCAGWELTLIPFFAEDDSEYLQELGLRRSVRVFFGIEGVLEYSRGLGPPRSVRNPFFYFPSPGWQI